MKTEPIKLLGIKCHSKFNDYNNNNSGKHNLYIRKTVKLMNGNIII